MKRAFLINAFTRGGAEKVLSVLLHKFYSDRYDIELILLENDKTFMYPIPENCKVTYLLESDEKHSGIKKLLMIPILAWKLKQYLKQEKITLVQSHLYRANYINVLSSLMGGGQITQIVNHGIVSRYKQKGVLGKINLLLIKHLYPKADLLITISKAMQNDMQDLFNFKSKQTVINNPYDIDNIKNLALENVTDFTYDQNKFYLISIGRLIPLKRNQDIVRAIKELPEHIELIILGEGDGKENLNQLVHELGIKQRVHFLGRVSNPFKYISKSDIFILASESEGFPNVLVESMISGTPVISSDCISGPREILAPNSNVKIQLNNDIELAEYGILFPMGDVENLTKAIKMLLEDSDLRKQYIYKAKQRAEDFSVEKIVNQYKKVLKL